MHALFFGHLSLVAEDIRVTGVEDGQGAAAEETTASCGVSLVSIIRGRGDIPEGSVPVPSSICRITLLARLHPPKSRDFFAGQAAEIALEQEREAMYYEKTHHIRRDMV